MILKIKNFLKNNIINSLISLGFWFVLLNFIFTLVSNKFSVYLFLMMILVNSMHYISILLISAIIKGYTKTMIFLFILLDGFFSAVFKSMIISEKIETLDNKITSALGIISFLSLIIFIIKIILFIKMYKAIKEDNLQN